MATRNSVLSVSAGVLLGVIFLIRRSSCQQISECKRSGDYLWKKSSPNKFYFCYRIGYAMSMECLDDRTMCKVPGKVFAPCMCQKDTDKISYDTCEEQFRLVPATGRAGGKLMPKALTAEKCEDYCLKTMPCVAFTFRPSMQECRIYLAKPDMPKLQPMTGVNYFVKKACALKFGYKHREVKTGLEAGLSSTTAHPDPDPGNGTPIPADPALSPAGSGDGGGVFENENDDSSNDVEAKKGDEDVATPFTSLVDKLTTPQTPLATTTTIPDSGCPYGLKKFENMSHRGGVLLKQISDIESCKNWCLNVGYCKGVDFDMVLSMCYYHRVILDSATTDAENVMHIRKMSCQPPLKCWSQISYNSSNVDPSTPQIPCQGVCFVREKIFNTYSVFERGCHASRPTERQVGCEVDGALTGLTCFCDTDRCNGLSIGALASVILHLPLDDNGADHSILGRNGQSALGYDMPEVSCLEKAINCSMVFNGQQCIEVPQMASQAWGDVNLQNEFTAMFTVSVCNISTGVVTAGISTDNTQSYKPDFPYIEASPNEWHHIATTYDSTYDPSENQFPLLRVYLDGVEVPGNMHSDMGNILVRRQPVTVGCVMGRGFVGCIDDLRIFAAALSKADIQALLQMNDGLYQ